MKRSIVVTMAIVLCAMVLLGGCGENGYQQISQDEAKEMMDSYKTALSERQ